MRLQFYLNKKNAYTILGKRELKLQFEYYEYLHYRQRISCSPEPPFEIYKTVFLSSKFVYKFFLNVKTFTKCVFWFRPYHFLLRTAFIEYKNFFHPVTLYENDVYFNSEYTFEKKIVAKKSRVNQG